MTNVIIILVLAVVLGGAGTYLYRARKQGAQCIGCPSAKTCSGRCGCCTSCKRPDSP